MLRASSAVCVSMVFMYHVERETERERGQTNRDKERGRRRRVCDSMPWGASTCKVFTHVEVFENQAP